MAAARRRSLHARPVAGLAALLTACSALACLTLWAPDRASPAAEEQEHIRRRKHHGRSGPGDMRSALAQEDFAPDAAVFGKHQRHSLFRTPDDTELPQRIAEAMDGPADAGGASAGHGLHPPAPEHNVAPASPREPLHGAPHSSPMPVEGAVLYEGDEGDGSSPSRAMEAQAELATAAWKPRDPWQGGAGCPSGSVGATHLVPGGRCSPNCSECQMVCLPAGLESAFTERGGMLGVTCFEQGCARYLRAEERAGVTHLVYACDRTAMRGVTERAHRSQQRAHAHLHAATVADGSEPAPNVAVLERSRRRVPVIWRRCIYAAWVLGHLVALLCVFLHRRRKRTDVAMESQQHRSHDSGDSAAVRAAAEDAGRDRGEIGGGGGDDEEREEDDGSDDADVVAVATDVRRRTAKPLTSARLLELEQQLRAAKRQAGDGADHPKVVALQERITQERRRLLGLPVGDAEGPSEACERSGTVSVAEVEEADEVPRGRRQEACDLCVLFCSALSCAALLALVYLLETGTITILGPDIPVIGQLGGLQVADSTFDHWVTAQPPAEPALAAAGTAPAPRPNVLLYLADDMGWADPAAFGLYAWGRTNNTTPNLDRLVREGLMLTHMITEPVCTPARAALLTGRYPQRYGLSANMLPERDIFTPGAPAGLPKSEITIARALKAAGYATGMSGKWHLGASANSVEPREVVGGGVGRAEQNGTFAFLPHAHGFDDSLVFPFTNMPRCTPYPGHLAGTTEAAAPEHSDAEPPEGYARSPEFCFLVANTTIVQQPAFMYGLQENLVRHAQAFIRRAEARGDRWFHFFADMHPHTSLYTSPRFGPGPPGPFNSANGQFGQVMAELDWAVGELLDEIDNLGATERTLVIFTSDNGPHREEGYAACGRAGGLRGGKGQLWEGGIRVPGIVRWPSVVPRSTVSDAPVRTLDVLPTLVSLAGVRMPPGLAIDGVDQSRFFRTAQEAHNPWARTDGPVQLHFCGERVIAARVGWFKVYWSSQQWAAPGRGSASGSGTYDATVCTECCPNVGWTGGLFGSSTVCQCDAPALRAHSPPAVFDLRTDRNETRAVYSGDAYRYALRRASAARDEWLATVRNMSRAVPCVNCMLPLPLTNWPCCIGHAHVNATACTTRTPNELMRDLLGLGSKTFAERRHAVEKAIRFCTSATDRALAAKGLPARNPPPSAGPGMVVAGGASGFEHTDRAVLGTARGLRHQGSFRRVASDFVDDDGLDESRPCTCNLCAPGNARANGACSSGWL